MTIHTTAILKQYDDNQQKYRKLEEFVKDELSKTIKEKGIKTHNVSSRIKTLDSLLDKARRNKITKPFEQIHDLVGFRVVCLFLQDLEDIRTTICHKFDVFEEDNKINSSELNVFGYMSLHLKCKIKNTQLDPKADKTIKNIPFEIQIRTIAQDAWASISHHLDYKKDSTIPEELRRDFHALSGLFYVADTHFSILSQEKTKLLFKKST